MPLQVDHADHRFPTLQHEIDHTDHTDNTDQGSIFLAILSVYRRCGGTTQLEELLSFEEKFDFTAPRYVCLGVSLHSHIPGGVVGDPRAHQNQFRGFKSHRLHARRDCFLHTKVD